MADPDSVGRVTGIGGMFFLANNDNDSLAKWYEEHLGIPLQKCGGGILEWKNDGAEDGGLNCLARCCSRQRLVYTE